MAPTFDRNRVNQALHDFAIAGPGVPPSGTVALPFNLTGIAATVCAALGVTPDEDWTGTAARFIESDNPLIADVR